LLKNKKNGWGKCKFILIFIRQKTDNHSFTNKTFNMFLEGNLFKLAAEYNDPVSYWLPLNEKLVYLNELIGHSVKIHYQGIINCIKCGRRTPKSYQQGFCYQCFMTAPEADPGIINPELDMAHEGISRDMEWAKTYSLVEHTVYLSLTSGIKVGVTRSSNVYTRWIDQGASQAISLAKTPYRHLAGIIEVELKKHFNDKTNWQDMLCGRTNGNTDLIAEKKRAAMLLPEELKTYLTEDDSITHINYPVTRYLDKVKSIDIEKLTGFSGILTGIKGQYLMFDDMVLNVRKYGGYLVSFEY